MSTGVVALAEIGDKSQLLVLALSTKFRKPVPIILGMLSAILVNHAGVERVRAVLEWAGVRMSGKIAGH